MEEQFLSAGTLVGAVLETAGLVTQAKILADFQEFLNVVGAYFYAIAGLGAIISFALFGSYRMIRYLLIAPAIFWFLTTSTYPTTGTYWQLGNGEPQTVRGSAEFEPIEVGTAFYLYTSVVSDVINMLVGEILQYQTEEDLTFFGRRFAMQTLIDAMPIRPRLVNIMYNDLYTNCGGMMNVALARTDRAIGTVALGQWQAIVAGEWPAPEQAAYAQQEIDRILERRSQLETAFATQGADRVTVGPDTIGLVSNNPDRFPAGSLDSVFFPYGDSLRSNPSMTCNDLWTVAKQAILIDSEELISGTLGSVLMHSSSEATGQTIDIQALSPDEQEDALCRTLAKKIGAAEVSTVDCVGEALVPTVAVFMLRNMIARLPNSEVVTNIKNRSLYYRDGAPRAKEKRINPETGEAYFPKLDFKNPKFRVIDQVDTQTGESAGPILKMLIEDGDESNPNDYVVFDLNVSDGHLGVAYIYHQRYQSKFLQQGIYSYAMNLPYYQGAMLYFITIAYPFMAFLVLMPGKAAQFLNLALMWLWVKSWDLGFALVMVLEKILWQILPNSNVEFNALADLPLPDLLVTAFQFDQAFDIHAHYNYITMVLLAIPPVSGYAILRGKYSILASFVDGPRAHAMDGGGIAQGRYGMTVMADKISAMKDSEGLTLVGTLASPVGSSAIKSTAMNWAGIAMLGEAAQHGANLFNSRDERDPDRDPGNMDWDVRLEAEKNEERRRLNRQNAGASALSGMATTGYQTYQRMRNRGVDALGQNELAFGDYKEDRKRFGAVFAAMDAFGEHEMTHFLSGREAMQADIRMAQAKLGIGADVVMKGLALGTAFAHNRIQDRYGKRGYERDPDGNLVERPNPYGFGKKGGLSALITGVMVKEFRFDSPGRDMADEWIDEGAEVPIFGKLAPGMFQRTRYVRDDDGIGFHIEIVPHDYESESIFDDPRISDPIDSDEFDLELTEDGRTVLKNSPFNRDIGETERTDE